MKDTNKTTRMQQPGKPALNLLLPQGEGRDEGNIKKLPNPLIAAIILCLAWTAIPANAQAQQLNIPAQALDNALTELADTADLKLLYQSAVVSNLKSHAVSGNYTPNQALDIMLGDTGLQYRSTGVNAITVEKNPALNNPSKVIPVKSTPEPQSETTMEKVTVEADSSYDPEYYADPYNKDYVIPNATAGTKTDTPIMETPLNVQVISKQVLKDQQVIRLSDSLKNVSGVVTRTNATTGNLNTGVLGGTQQGIFLRGFESQTFFRNGFRLQQGAASKGLANVESIEVLKGPAAILYGQVEPGGMVNVITKQPLATPYYGFTQQFGSYDLYRTTLDATGPITKNKDLLYRVNMSYENSGSFRDLVDKEDVFLAPVFKWAISPQTQVTFEMEYNHQHQGTDNGFIPFSNGNIPNAPVLQPMNVPLSRNYGDYSPATTETIFGGFNWSHQFNDDWSVKHSFSANHNSVTSPFSTRPLVSGTKGYLQTALGDDPNRGLLPDDLLVVRTGLSPSFSQNNTYSTNLDLIGHFDTVSLKHTVLFGGDYYRLDQNSDAIEPSTSPFSYISLNNPAHPGTPFGPFDHSIGKTDNSTDQYGLYIQDQIKLPYGFQVMGGIRYQYIHQKNSVLFDGTTTSSSLAQDAVTPRVGLLWQPKKWLSLYANYAESFGANTSNALEFVRKGVFKPVAPTSANQYEGGIKAEFFDGKLRANLAYYDLTKTNVAVGDLAIDPTTGLQRNCGTGPGSCSLALGEVRSRGPELDITGEILPGWNVIATWANTDIIVTSSDFVGATGGSFKKGSRLPNVPRNIGRLWSTYEVQNGDYKGIIFGGGVNLRDRQLPADEFGEGQVSYKTPGYATFDLMAGYSRQLGDAKVSVQLNVDNLLDKHYITSLSALPSEQASFVDFGQPRTFMGQVSVQY
jgi:iron complex outermembrane recepter protein